MSETKDRGARAGAPSFAELDRRAFLATSGRCGFWGVVGAVAAGLFRKALAAEPPDYPGGFTREQTQGCAAAPLTEEQELVAAFLDTVVPGAATDPDGAPGALEAGGLDLAYDDFYPLRANLSALLFVIDNEAKKAFDQDFVELSQEEREEVLHAAQSSLPLLRHAFRFVRAVFFDDLRGGLGSQYVGFPGPNLGYVDHPEFSFRKPMSKELTKDGRMP